MGSMISKLIPARKMLTFMALGVLALSILASFTLQPASAFNIAVDQSNEQGGVAQPKPPGPTPAEICVEQQKKKNPNPNADTLDAIYEYCICVHISKLGNEDECYKMYGKGKFKKAVFISDGLVTADQVATTDSSVSGKDKNNPKKTRSVSKSPDLETTTVVETSPDSPEPTILEDTVVTFQDSQVVAETSTTDSPEVTVSEEFENSVDSPEVTIALDPLVTTFVLSP